MLEQPLKDCGTDFKVSFSICSPREPPRHPECWLVMWLPRIQMPSVRLPCRWVWSATKFQAKRWVGTGRCNSGAMFWGGGRGEEIPSLSFPPPSQGWKVGVDMGVNMDAPPWPPRRATQEGRQSRQREADWPTLSLTQACPSARPCVCKTETLCYLVNRHRGPLSCAAQTISNA